MRLLKSHSHTSERLGYEADQEYQVKRERKGAYPKRRENSKETTAVSTGRGWGAGRKRVDGKSKTQRIARGEGGRG